ncbi:MAG: MOSC domain-containing protein [Pseudomonadota bacterium]
MTLLTPTEFYAEITWLGTVADSEADISAVACKTVDVGWEGFQGDCHSGLTRPACVRVKKQYKRNLEIRNTRQISIVSAEELAEVAERLGLERLDPAWLGASMVVKGIPDFTLIPPASRLIFEGSAALTIDTENAPCRYPADVIEAAHPGHGKGFVTAAKHRRGVTAWVERTGRLALGDRARLHVPPRRLHPLV